jgi:hypothetical protein
MNGVSVFVERLEQAAPVVIAFENGFAAVATIHHVVDRAGGIQRAASEPQCNRAEIEFVVNIT